SIPRAAEPGGADCETQHDGADDDRERGERPARLDGQLADPEDLEAETAGPGEEPDEREQRRHRTLNAISRDAVCPVSASVTVTRRRKSAAGQSRIGKVQP